VIPKLWTTHVDIAFLLYLVEILQENQRKLCVSPDEDALLEGLVMKIISDATTRLPLELAPKRAPQHIHYYHTQPSMTVNVTPAIELVRVCYLTGNSSLVHGVLERIRLIVTEQNTPELQSCMASKLLLPILPKLRSIISNQNPPMDDVAVLGDLAHLAITLEVAYMTSLPKLEDLTLAITLGGGATAIKTL
jgi:hypothetical protein